MDAPVSVTMTLERGLRLLHAFHAERTPLTNAELARRTRLPASTVSRLTTTLIRLGYLRRVAGGPRLVLAMGVFGIGQAYLETSMLARAAHPLMQTLADRLDACVALAQPDGLDMLCIAYRASARIASLRLGIGALLPMGVTASGRAWLASQSASVRHRYAARLSEAAGPRAEKIGAGIAAACAELQATGACTAYGEYQRHAWGIAVPVRIGRLRMVLSCGAVAPDADLDALRQRAVPALAQTAKQLRALAPSQLA